MYLKPTDLNVIIPGKYSPTCGCSGCAAIETVSRAAADKVLQLVKDCETMGPSDFRHKYGCNRLRRKRKVM
jgi:hypothetical protein